MKASSQSGFNPREVVTLVTELTINPKGSIKLSIDLEKRLLKWQESNRWNRNFTRTLSLLELNEIRNFIHNANFSKWPEGSKKSTSARESEFHSIWSLRLLNEKGGILYSHLLYDQNPDYYLSFCDSISLFCRQAFTVSD